MGQFIRTNGDYNIKTVDGGTITLDTGPRVGRVRLTGNLVVEGDTLTLSAQNLEVDDNIITLNNGETGAGVSLNFSGIEIDRGSLNKASFVFDESTDTWRILYGSLETGYNTANTALQVGRITTDPDTNSGDLTLIGFGGGVVKVSGTTNYRNQIANRVALDIANSTNFADDILVNKAYVDFAIGNNPTAQIRGDDTRVIIADKNVSPNDIDTVGSFASFTNLTGYTIFSGESAVNVLVDGLLTAQFFSNRTEIGNLEFTGTEITTKEAITNENITIRTQGTGKLSTNFAVELNEINVIPGLISGSNVIWAASDSVGGTGLFFNNTSSGTGEFISKRRSLVFSMLF
jgi:hypothetical protein